MNSTKCFDRFAISLLLLLVLSVCRMTSAHAQVQSPEDAVVQELRTKIDALQLSGCTITDVQLVKNGSFTPKATGKIINNLPPFCLIAATLSPAKGSLIRIELWMPIENWQGRLLGTGNGGGAGSIAYESLAGGIRKGYATVNTDMGTSRGGAHGAVGNPDTWADFGYRATHEMTVVAKKLLKVYYGKAAHHAYFTGCSTGGQQGLMEAQRFPEDYDGIIAGAPANNRTHLHTGFIWNYQVTNNGGQGLFTAAELAYIANKIITAYGQQSGSAPGDKFLTNPALVHVNFDSLFQCSAGDTGICLNATKIAALKKVYTGPVNPRTKEQIYTAPPVGTEHIGGGLSTQQATGSVNGLLYPFKWAFGKDFDYKSFDFDKDLAKLDSILAPVLNANNPDLMPFKKHGGKLIMYTGTADPLVPYQDAVQYYERVVAKQQGLKQTQSFFRYYLLPGMAHCSGGPGLNGFSRNILDELVDWVEHKKAPEQIMAQAPNCCEVNGPPRLQRPVYPYPQFPQYIGGAVDAAASYIGSTPR